MSAKLRKFSTRFKAEAVQVVAHTARPVTAVVQDPSSSAFPTPLTTLTTRLGTISLHRPR